MLDHAGLGYSQSCLHIPQMSTLHHFIEKIFECVQDFIIVCAKW